MGVPCDDFVVIRQPETAGEPTVVTVNCPDKTGLGCDLCRHILAFGLSIVRGGEKGTRWSLLKKRLLEACPAAAAGSALYKYYYKDQQEMKENEEQKPRVFLLKFFCYDRVGLLHDVTQVLCDLELTIKRVKVSTTPDGRVMDLFFITDTRELLHTKKRKEETCEHLRAVLGDSTTSFDIEPAPGDIAAFLQASPFLPPEINEDMFNLELPNDEEKPTGSQPSSTTLSVTIDNSLSPAHSLIQIFCRDHKGLLYDVMRTLKDYKIQISYGRFYASHKGHCDLDLFVVQMDGKKIVDPNKQKALCDRLRMELYSPLRVHVLNRGPDTELLVANPVELSNKGRPLVFYDITLALKLLHSRIFVAEICRHVIGDREWEVYRVILGDDYELSNSRIAIVDRVTNMLMGWE